MSGHPPQRGWSEIYRTSPKDYWFAARVHVKAPYPCRCRRPCNPQFCHCWGRDDIGHLPRTCCALRHPKHHPPATPTQEAQA